MSFKTSLVKVAIDWTPHVIVLWVANFILKGIAELSDFDLDLDVRKAYFQATLYGESEAIEVSLAGLTIESHEDGYHLIIQEAQANRPWLQNLLSRFTQKAWKIPEIPQYQSYIDLVAELFKPESSQSQDD